MKRLSSTPHGRLLVYLSCLITLVFVAGCSTVNSAIRAARYDEVTDSSLAAIQQKTDDFVASLKKNFGTDAASLENSKGFYGEIGQDLLRLETRVRSIPENVKTENLVHNIRMVILGDGTVADVTSLKYLHGIPGNVSRGIPMTTLEITHRNISQIISSARSLELEKARP
jgi:hypothetical protein